jgi:hypothetical protein
MNAQQLVSDGAPARQPSVQLVEQLERVFGAEVQNYDTPSMPGMTSISVPATWRDNGHKA